jgi:hypothetical protein
VLPRRAKKPEFNYPPFFLLKKSCIRPIIHLTARENLFVKEESVKDLVKVIIVSVAVVISAFLIKTGLEGRGGAAGSQEAFSLYGYEGVLYRLNNVNGRLDVLVPSNEAAILFPVGQMQLPNSTDQLSDKEKESFSTNLKTLSLYIQGERGRSLGLKPEAPKAAA